MTRAWGTSVNERGDVRACVTAPIDSPIRSKLDAGGAIALTVVNPATYSSAQLKGVVAELSQPTEHDQELAESHLRRFTDTSTAFGLVAAERLMIGSLVAVGFHAVEVYDQTPGVDAGQEMT